MTRFERSVAATLVLFCAASLAWGHSPRAMAQDDPAPQPADLEQLGAQQAGLSQDEVAPRARRGPHTLHAGDVTDAASEEGPTRLSWPSDARRPGWLELGLGGGLAGLGAAIPMLFKPHSPRWRGGVLFDGWVRGGLRLSRSQRANVATASDVMLYSTLSIPFMELAAEGIAGRVDGDLALRILLVQLQSFGVTGFVTAIPKVTARRERPYGRRCEADPSELGCDSSERYVSFFSGHTSLTFTAAGLSCVMHQELRLFGNARRDAAACGLALAAATGTGVLRIIADKHWTTDVLMGATVGLLSGWLMPYLLYFRGHDTNEDTLPSLGIRAGVFSPWADPSGAGLRYDALF